jgi:hypothetical protein
MTTTMTPEHSRWSEFFERLFEAFNVNVHSDLGLNWRRCQSDQALVRAILAEMGMDVEASCRFFESHGYSCDCAVLFARSPSWRTLRPKERRTVMMMERFRMHIPYHRAVIIKRSLWNRARSGHCALPGILFNGVNYDCLGFVCQQLFGMTDKEILGQRMPDEIGVPNALTGLPGNLVQAAAELNDRVTTRPGNQDYAEMSDAEQEHRLARLFATIGIEVQYVD